LAEQLVASPAQFNSEEDRGLFLELRGQLWEYEPLRATLPDFQLDVRHGTVWLSGRVRTLAMKEIVGYICKRADRVGVVENNLVSDTEVVRAVADALAADPELGPLCLRVDARDGVVTLSGDLPDAGLERRALEAARNVAVVQDVASELVVRPPARWPTAPRPKPAGETADQAGVAGGASRKEA
jgi:osmotically-inducible protein OsmY